MKVRSRTVAYVSELMLLTSIIGCGGGSSEINEQVKDESTSTPAVEKLNIIEEKGDSTASVTEENSWELQGQILDQQGRPVADVGISNVWNANGVPLEEIFRFEKEGGDDTFLFINERRMEPWGLHPTKSDAEGKFSMQMGYRDDFLLAIDKERKRGALIVIDPRNAPSSVVVKLVPLVRLHGRVRIAATGQELKDVTVCVRLPPNEKLPLSKCRFAMCFSQKSRFEFWLPPGDYQLEATAHMMLPYELARFQSVTLASGQRDVESGTLELTPAPPVRDRLRDQINDAKEKGTWVDIQKHFGKPAPDWHITDARGVAKDVTITAFKGKWVLLYFWGPW